MVEVARGVILDPDPLLIANNRAAFLSEHASGSGVSDEEANLAEVSIIAPAFPGCFPVGVAGEPAQEGTCILGLADLVVRLIIVELSWREVTEVLVDPVRHQPPGNPFFPRSE